MMFWSIGSLFMANGIEIRPFTYSSDIESDIEVLGRTTYQVVSSRLARVTVILLAEFWGNP